jgi:hypothetical protein
VEPLVQMFKEMQFFIISVSAGILGSERVLVPADQRLEAEGGDREETNRRRPLARMGQTAPQKS